LFAFLALVCLTWTTLFAVFLSREWSHFARVQKVVVVGLLALYGCTAILLYLMIVVHYVFWWDVARVIALLSIHAVSSVLFMHFSPNFPCRGFSTESMCRNYVHTMLIGCWVFTGIVFCFAIALGIMAFIPRPVESLPGEEDVPPSPASFGTGSPTDEERHTSFYSIDSRTGLVTYKDQSPLLDVALSPDSDFTPISRAFQETITEGPPRHLQGSQNSPILSLSHDDSTNDGTISRGDFPGDRTSVGSGPQRVVLFQSDPFRDLTSPPSSINSQASMIRTGVGGEISPLSEDRPGRTLPSIPLRNPPTLVTTQRDRATEYTPSFYSIHHHHHSLPTSFESDSKPEPTSPDHLQAMTPSAYSFHSLAASVHSKWAEPTSHAMPPPALTPGVSRFREPFAFWGLTGLTYVAPFGAWGSKPGLVRKISEPTGTMQRFSGDAVRQPTDLHVKESSFPRRGSDGQIWDRTQWERLVLRAAGKS